DRPRRGRVARSRRDRAVAGDRAVGDARELAPDAPLEVRATRRERQVERLSLAGEVLTQLPHGLTRGLGVAHGRRAGVALQACDPPRLIEVVASAVREIDAM